MSVALDWVAHEPSKAEARRVSLRGWVGVLVGLDVCMALIATAVGLAARFGDATQVSLEGVPYTLVAAAIALAWVAALAVGGGYDQRFLAAGAQEYRTVVNSGVWVTGLTAFIVFVSHVPLSRVFVGVAFPLLLALTLTERKLARRALHRQVAQGRPIYRTVVVGRHSSAQALIKHIRRVPWAGFDVVATCGVRETATDEILDVDHLIDLAHSANADTIAVAGDQPFRNGTLRQLSWQLEGTGIRLVVAPAITDIAGPRIMVRPVEGLPLLMIEEPEFTGAARVVKAMMDRGGAALVLVLLGPMLLAISLAIKLASPGPVLFKQERVGLHGERFLLWKFRTMRHGSDREQHLLDHMNEADGLLFKIRNDPRVTAVGRWLRAHSLDELPQIWNVLQGHMSLVGPRPPLPKEVAHYGDDVRRRLLVKPGMTGLWQVSGRADLPWEETVRLDLHYVENWSVTLDLMVLWKTFAAVRRGKGAY